MRGEGKNDLVERTTEFGLRIVRMFVALPKTEEARVLGKQVLRSGTSIGANYREARRGRSGWAPIFGQNSMRVLQVVLLGFG